jgi:hypothetical protein
VTRVGWTSALALSLALGCAAQYEEPTGAQPDSDVALERMPASEVAEPAPTTIAPADRSLADLERELAGNESQLRALGVPLPVHGVTGGGGGGDNMTFGGEKSPTSFAPKPDAVPEAVPGAAPDGDYDRGAGGNTPTSQPRPVAPSRGDTVPHDKPKEGRKNKPGKADKPKKESADIANAGGFAPPPPEEAKATPLSPNEQPQLDAATRCAQVCSLSDITCELGVQICELAQRHTGNEEYERACVRATEDCDAAQEACDACTGG